MEEGTVIEQLPDLKLAQWKFLLKQSDEISGNKLVLRNQLIEAIKQDSTKF
jgi:hypothetical protein